jgi:hypothetical protein
VTQAAEFYQLGTRPSIGNGSALLEWDLTVRWVMEDERRFLLPRHQLGECKRLERTSNNQGSLLEHQPLGTG